MTNVLLIGAGNMGFAMLRSWTGLAGHRFVVVEVNDALQKRAQDVGASSYADLSDLPPDYRADILVIATKPQGVADAIAAGSERLTSGGLIISIAAGVTLDGMRQKAGENAVVIRAMPNTPAAIGEGMIVCCTSGNADVADRRRAETLLSAIGRVVFVGDECLMDAVTAVSGSGPAYLFYFLEAFSAAGVSAGLPPDIAMLLAKQTLYGSAKMALDPMADPSALRVQVTSPNGTTAAALSVLMDADDGLAPLLRNAVEAARLRSGELGRLA
ncbi:pyrroline-5-carboxylate reductase [Agrobacterium tumefaciens]|uniref:pyrroline-5-carboxylate reductase n=1 Tax=Agrobacterium tumefaciens TaxID=358 RepID=UPI00287C0D42|nr:pyrroline-5-carboxylate reductase [Agrobacterium tumefaciens]MDS7594402.1 pyrroline-5-carboxylate reductase [Agrobacterium tumefaciens]